MTDLESYRRLLSTSSSICSPPTSPLIQQGDTVRDSMKGEGSATHTSLLLHAGGASDGLKGVESTNVINREWTNSKTTISDRFHHRLTDPGSPTSNDQKPEAILIDIKEEADQLMEKKKNGNPLNFSTNSNPLNKRNESVVKHSNLCLGEHARDKLSSIVDPPLYAAKIRPAAKLFMIASVAFTLAPIITMFMDSPSFPSQGYETGYYSGGSHDFVSTVTKATTAGTGVNFTGGYNRMDSLAGDFVEINATTTERPCNKAHSIPRFHEPFFIVEAVCTGWFLSELILRFVASPHCYLFFRNPLNWIDFLSILPLPYFIVIGVAHRYDIFFLDNVAILTVLLRIFRCLRLFRLFKFFRFSRDLHLMCITFKKSAKLLLLYVVIVFILITFFSILLTMFEAEQPDTKIKSMFDSCYFTIITMTTLGYGDIVPVSRAGKIISCACVVTAPLMYATPLAALGSSFYRAYQEQDDGSERGTSEDTTASTASQGEGALTVSSD